MKKGRKILVSILLIGMLAASFFAGRYMAQLEHAKAGSAHCEQLISFAIDKAENDDLADPGTMRALISNVYAAYQFCDNTRVAAQLHDLWNFLIFESDSDLEAAKETALIELNDAFQALKTGA